MTSFFSKKIVLCAALLIMGRNIAVAQNSASQGVGATPAFKSQLNLRAAGFLPIGATEYLSMIPPCPVPP
jgi:hypothetical protein